MRAWHESNRERRADEYLSCRSEQINYESTVQVQNIDELFDYL